MYTKIILSNLALSNLGVTKQIESLTERQKEANVCNQWADIVIDEMLRQFVWPFATKFVNLSLVSEDPTIEWKYAYRYPVDALCLRRILSGVRNDTRATRVPYRLGADAQGKLIYTDMEDAQMEYTSKTLGRDPTGWDADFLTCTSYRLSARIAPGLTAGDPFKMGQLAQSMYRLSYSQTTATAANEEQAEDIPPSEFELSRS